MALLKLNQAIVMTLECSPYQSMHDASPIAVITPLLVPLAAPSFPVPPDSEIGEFQIQGHADAFGVHLRKCWLTTPPLAGLSEHHDPHHRHLASAGVGGCSDALTAVHHNPS
jgi:hypothetical protein